MPTPIARWWPAAAGGGAGGPGARGGGGLFGMAQAMMGLADRVTYIIDEQGTIAHVIDSPSVMNHAEEVLARL